MRLGVHVSIAGGLSKAAERAAKRGCQTFQIFTGNPRSWKSRDFSDEEIKKFKAVRSQYGLRPLAAHTPYLINLATPDSRLWKLSTRKLIEALKRCQQIGSDYLVTHLGSHAGRGEGWGGERVAQAITEALPDIDDGTTLLLENSAGSGFSVGYSFEQIGDILAIAGNHPNLGVCIDTCHAFAAGYDMSNEDGLTEVLNAFNRAIGLGRLKLIHANDSKGSLGSRIDRHESVGKGMIGIEGFRILINDPKLRDLPFILETPGMDASEDVKNLKLLKSLVKAQNEKGR